MAIDTDTAKQQLLTLNSKETKSMTEYIYYLGRESSGYKWNWDRDCMWS